MCVDRLGYVRLGCTKTVTNIVYSIHFLCYSKVVIELSRV